MPNAIPGRDSIEVEIYGMEGIPEEDRLAHERQKIGKLFWSQLFVLSGYSADIASHFITRAFPSDLMSTNYMHLVHNVIKITSSLHKPMYVCHYEPSV